MTGHELDEHLFARIRARDTEALRQLFDRYVDALTTFATRMVRAPDVADDIVADVFAALWLGAQDRPPASVRAYLFGAVRNRALTALHKDRRATDWEARFAAGDVPGLGDRTELPSAPVERADQDAMLRAAVQQLPERTQSIVWLRWAEGLSFEEIARVVGGTAAAAQMQHGRALKTLRGLLDGR